jgi:hypothetical protein
MKTIILKTKSRPIQFKDLYYFTLFNYKSVSLLCLSSRFVSFCGKDRVQNRTHNLSHEMPTAKPDKNLLENKI